MLLAAGCSGPPVQDELKALLVSEAALPSKCDVGLIRVYREDMGDFQQDHTDIYQLVADKPCQDAWRSELVASGDWQCTKEMELCQRGVGNAPGEAELVHYRNEWGTVRFIANDLVQVELTKI